MGNHFRKLLVSPVIPEHAFRKLAVALRSRQKSPMTLVICDLKGKRPRMEHVRLAQELGVRQIELEGNVLRPVLFEVCDSTLGPSNRLYREQDDEEMDICFPGPDWIEKAFGTKLLTWLLEIEEKPIAWNKWTLHAFPGNPPQWDVAVPVNVGLLQVARANENRPCSRCGATYVSKRDDRCQCPHCGEVALPFSSKEDAKRIDEVPLDAFSWGKCTRCRQSKQFTNRLEQCQRCGRLLRAISRHNTELQENAEAIEIAVADWLKTD
jgi:ribosomal protein S27AE